MRSLCVLQVIHDANGTTVSDLTCVDVNTPQVGVLGTLLTAMRVSKQATQQSPCILIHPVP